MKAENWIKWDLDSRAGVKMSAFVAEYGAQGYGVFIWLVEILYRAEDQKFLLDTNGYKCITKSFKVEQKLLEEMICTLCEYGLFKMEGNYLFSARVRAEVLNRLSISEKRQLAVKTRWQARQKIQTDTNVLQTDTKPPREEERRGEESTNIILNPPSGGRVKKPKPPDVEVFYPQGFTEVGKAALAEWLTYKKGRRESYKSNDSINRLLKHWSKFPETEFVQSVDQSIRNNWAGLFDVKKTGVSSVTPMAKHEARMQHIRETHQKILEKEKANETI